jgi:hypothetical protein
MVMGVGCFPCPRLSPRKGDEQATSIYSAPNDLASDEYTSVPTSKAARRLFCLLMVTRAVGVVIGLRGTYREARYYVKGCPSSLASTNTICRHMFLPSIGKNFKYRSSTAGALGNQGKGPRCLWPHTRVRRSCDGRDNVCTRGELRGDGRI